MDGSMALAVKVPAAVRLLVIAEDGDEYILGRHDVGVYVAVPEPGAVFIRALQEGCSIAQATARASAAAGADVDGAEFLTGLAAAGLLDAAEDEGASAASDAAVRRPGRAIRWVEGISPRTARLFFGWPAWLLYGAAAATSVILLSAQPALRPSYSHVWWLADPVVSILVYLPIGFALAAMHEVWHWLAGRAIGVPAAFRVSRRGLFLVFETDLSQIVTVSRRARYGPFLAGMAFDVTILAAVLGLRYAHRAGVVVVPAVLDRLLGVIALYLVIGVAWQWAALFLRSDGYAVLANALRCHNLYRATVLTTKWRLWRLTDEEGAELDAIGSHDRAVARWFGLVYLTGMIVMCWMALSYGVPFVVSMGGWIVANLAAFSPAYAAFWESLAVLAYLVIGYLAPAAIAWRERQLRRAGRLL
jgi:putative peptide zinc metalloprotease protein